MDTVSLGEEAEGEIIIEMRYVVIRKLQWVNEPDWSWGYYCCEVAMGHGLR